MANLDFTADQIASKNFVEESVPSVDQTYNAKSANAQSGIAVAQAVDGCIPIPEYEETYGIEKVVVYDDADYQDYDYDENGNYVSCDRYIPPSAFKSRPIDYSMSDGANKTYTANRADYIAARDSNGNLWTGTPVDDVDCVNKKYADQFLPKQASNGMTFEAYVVSPTGNMTLEIEDNDFFRNGTSYGTIPCRQSNGNLYTNAPMDDLDCVPYSLYKALLERVETLEQKISSLTSE